MAKSYYVGSYKNRGRQRGKVIFFIVILLQLGAVGAYLYFKHDKSATPEPSTPASFSDPSTAQPSAADLAPSGLAPSGLAVPAPSAPAPAAPLATTPQIQNRISDAQAAIDAGQLLEAQKTLYSIIETSPTPEAIDLLGKVNMKLLNSPLMMPGKEYYVIQSGDYLQKIANKFHTTIALIKKMNGMQSDTIRLGDRLLVFSGKFTVQVSKSKNTLDLMLNGKLFKRYSVGTGKFGKTPAARFTIVDKIPEPTWTRPSDNRRIEYGDPENLLGSRWMAIKSKEHPEFSGFGIHGTWQRDSIGKQSSNGCIRMLNEEVEELFDILPRNTPVTITE